MTEQSDLFAARAARNAALAQVDDHAEPDWKSLARAAVVHLAETRAEFTSDAVWEIGVAKPREARALGPIMMWAARNRYIAATDRLVPSAQVKSHAMPKRVWRSLIL